MVRFPRVRYCLEAPSWPATSQASVPVFVAPPRLRCAWPLLARRAAARTSTLIDAQRAGADLRSALRFLLWLDTARCFAVEALEGGDELTAALDRHLPRPSEATRKSPVAVTAVVIAKNEEAALPGALRSLEPFADELVVIVDDQSTDATGQIATEMGARALTRSLGGDFAAQKNAGLSAVKTEWVICIDADERLESGLGPLLRQAMAWPEADAVFVPILNLITERGEEPVHWPDVQARVFRAHLRYRGVVHERVERWRRPLFVPVSGPYIRHEKSLLRQHRSTLLYDEIDPKRPYTREMIASVKEEMARLESARPSELD
jgi:hypothetical protein